MAFKLPNNVKQLSPTSGTSSYQFTSIVSGYAAFDAQLANGDTTVYFARDASAWEVGQGTFTTGPSTLSRTLIASSTGTLIAWPGSGTREVGCGLPAEWVTALIDPTITAGMPARTGASGWAFRTWQNGTFITITNPAGTAGNPTIVDSGLSTAFLRRNIAATMVAQLSLDYFSGGFLTVGGDGSEDMLGFGRVGAEDYLGYIRTGGGTWSRILTADASNLNDADRLQGSTLAQARKLSFYPGGNAYHSGALAITTQGVHTLAHSLGQVPSMVFAHLTCMSTEYGYTAGRVVPIGSGLNPGAPKGHVLEMDATNLYVKFANATEVYELLTLGGAGTAGATTSPGLTNANWTVEFHAYA